MAAKKPAAKTAGKAAGKTAGKAAASFDEIIQSDRQKRKNEELASQLLGKNRKTGAVTKKKAQTQTQNATGGSLASRIGVAKRNGPTPSKPKSQNKPAVAAAPPTGPKGQRARNANRRRPEEERLMKALNPASGQSNIRDNTSGLAIKGASSGPFVIVGSNFAPGTTAADIQSALEPLSGPVLNCWVTSQHPSVTAEITFAEKWSAETTIANFHNQKADGRVLSIRWKSAGAGSTALEPSFSDLREEADRQRRLARGTGGGRRGGNRGQNGQQGQGIHSDEMMVDAPPQNPRGHNRRHR